MNKENEKTALETEIQSRRHYQMLSGVLAIAILITVGMVRISPEKEIQTVFLPPKSETTLPFFVSNIEIDKNYAVSWAYTFVKYALDVTPKTVDRNHEIFLSYVDSGVYPELKKQLFREAKRIKSTEITQWFSPVNFDISTDNSQIVVHGEERTTVGNKSLPVQRKAYKITYKNKNSSLLISEFIEVNPSDPWGLRTVKNKGDA